MNDNKIKIDGKTVEIYNESNLMTDIAFDAITLGIGLLTDRTPPNIGVKITDEEGKITKIETSNINEAKQLLNTIKTESNVDKLRKALE